MDLDTKIVLQCIKYLHCISYQCCEGDVPETELYKKLIKLISTLESLYIYCFTGYQSLEWLNTP